MRHGHRLAKVLTVFALLFIRVLPTLGNSASAGLSQAPRSRTGQIASTFLEGVCNVMD